MTTPMFFVVKDSPAHRCFKRTMDEMKPGAIISVSQEEFESLEKDVFEIGIEPLPLQYQPDQKEDGGYLSNENLLDQKEEGD